MSVYSGFATRNQESTYFKFVNKLIAMMSDEILGRRRGFFAGYDESVWEKKVLKIYKALHVMEKQKYLDPHFSKSITELAHFLVGSIRGKFGMGAASLSGLSQMSAREAVQSLSGFGSFGGNNPLVNQQSVSFQDGNSLENEPMSIQGKQGFQMNNQQLQALRNSLKVHSQYPQGAKIQALPQGATIQSYKSQGTNDIVPEDRLEDDLESIAGDLDRNQGARSRTEEGQYRRSKAAILAQANNIPNNQEFNMLKTQTQGFKMKDQMLTSKYEFDGSSRQQQQLYQQILIPSSKHPFSDSFSISDGIKAHQTFQVPNPKAKYMQVRAVYEQRSGSMQQNYKNKKIQSIGHEEIEAILNFSMIIKVIIVNFDQE